ncbi:MAG: CPBP family intramembrane glutamic endopeptidase [Anaerolineales bacterium]
MNNVTAAKRTLPVTAWAAMLIISDLPDILITWLGGSIPAWMFWAKAGFLVLFLGLTLFWKTIRPLWQYAVVLLVLFLALGLVARLRSTDWFQNNFNYDGIPFFTGFAAIMALDILVALAVLAALWPMKRDRKDFFLVKGQLDAPIEPVRWLGIKAGESWKTFGWIFTGAAALAVAIPTIVAIAPSSETLLRALPFLPAALLFAAVNAFTEEAYYRASILSTLHETIDKSNALLIAVVFFGLGHWLYGSPPGIVGFLMTGFLAWLMGKSMLETKGFVWPWTIHFLPDVVVFFSYALLYVQA